jgi:pimeloyl-ACP methyl ester carboxylesterase
MAAFAALALVVLFGVMHADPAFAHESQESPESQAPIGVFGFTEEGLKGEDYSDSELHMRPPLQLIEVVDPAARAAARAKVRGVTPVTVGPFGPAYPFTRLRVYLGREMPPAEERGFSDSARIVLVVSAHDRRGRARWFRLAMKEDVSPSDLVNIYNERSEDERIGPAADPAIPLVLVRYQYASTGMSTRADVAVQLLLDFRAAQPNVLAGFASWHVEGGGACGTYDNQSGLKTATSCAWNERRGDFLCTERGVRKDTMWTERSMTRQFWLESGNPALFGSAVAAPFADLLAGAADGSVTAAVPDLGATHHLANGVLAGGTRFRLFAAPGISHELDARIVAVITRGGEASRLITLGRVMRIESEPTTSSADEAPIGAVAEQAASFTAIRVDGGKENRATAIYKIVVNEGSGSTMYLVAIDAAQDLPRLHALRLATDAQAYDACAHAAVPETAVRADVVTIAPFAMDIEVEPRRREDLVDVDEEEDTSGPMLESSESCAWRGTVRWTADGGFAVEKIADICDAHARIAKIEDDGSLSPSAVYQRVESDNVSARYLALGRGEPAVLLLPDPDFSERLWEPVLEQLARTRLTIVFAPRPSRHQFGDGLKALASDVQGIVDAVRVKRVFVVAHGLAAGYAVEWAAAHPELVAGFVLLDPIEQNWSHGPRLHALLGSPEDRQAYVRTLVPQSTNVEKIASSMREHSHSLDLVWLRATASLLGYNLYETSDRLKGIPIWTAGRQSLYGVTTIQSPGPFAMIENPATLATLLDTLINTVLR